MSDSTSSHSDALSSWTPEEIAAGRRWVETWRQAGIALERIRRSELRELDTLRTISHLCSSAPCERPLRPTSGLVEQQRWFKRAAGRE